MLTMIMWMYGGYAWLTNAVAPNSRVPAHADADRHGRLPGHLAGHPGGVRRAGWAFGLGYFVVNAVHTGLFTGWPAAPARSAAMRTLGPLNLLSATLDPGRRLPAGAVAVVGLWIAGRAHPDRSRRTCNPIGEFTISPAHFVERHGLVIIIALGESLVAIGVGAAGLQVDLLPGRWWRCSG